MEDKLSFLLSESMAAFCRANMNKKQNLPIRSSEMGVLIYISKHEEGRGVRPVEISDYFGIRKSSVSTIIVSLEGSGYIKRMVDENDKRSSPLFITEKGKRLVDETYEEYQQISKTLVTVLGEGKCQEFIDLLQTATTIIQKGGKE